MRKRSGRCQNTDNRQDLANSDTIKRKEEEMAQAYIYGRLDRSPVMWWKNIRPDLYMVCIRGQNWKH
jgi:hypothetical protein